MLLKVHSNAFYLNKSQVQSSYTGYFFCGDNQHHNKPLNLDGAILINASILKPIAASAVEAELGTPFHNSQSVQEFRLSPNEMGWHQTATSIICDNTTAGIANSTVKCQCPCAMNIRYFGIIDQVQNLFVHICWAPGLKKHADYFTKHHIAAHHV